MEWILVIIIEIERGTGVMFYSGRMEGGGKVAGMGRMYGRDAVGMNVLSEKGKNEGRKEWRWRKRVLTFPSTTPTPTLAPHSIKLPSPTPLASTIAPASTITPRPSTTPSFSSPSSSLASDPLPSPSTPSPRPSRPPLPASCCCTPTQLFSQTTHPSPTVIGPYVDCSLARGWMTVLAPRVMGYVPVRTAVSAMVVVGEMWRGGFLGCAVVEEGARFEWAGRGVGDMWGIGREVRVRLKKCNRCGGGRCSVCGLWVRCTSSERVKFGTD